MPIRILSVVPGSPADRAGIAPDDIIERINHEEVLDEIDYQALTSVSRIRMELKAGDGTPRTILLHKKSWEPLGVCLDETVQLQPRHCRNHCVFCFIDQMPPGMRETLYVKDDDWRLSLMMGNYVTLTNVDDREFQRLLKRRASPLYISVHATDPDVRIRMLRNPHAGNLLDRLRILKEHGLKFHSQIVLCPGINDGRILEQTLHDLVSLYPSAQSVAVVPIGLTRFREGLAPMHSVTPADAESLLDQLAPWQAYCLKTFQTRFVYASDEFYCISGRPLPENEDYEDYQQIENGVGMLRKFRQECEEAAEELGEPVPTASRRILIPTGVSAFPLIRELALRYAPPGTEVTVLPVTNRYFGESITVTGLIVGRDLLDAVAGISCDLMLLSETMLREKTDRFLDDMTLTSLQEQSGIPVRVVENRGYAFVRALRE